MHVWEAAVGLDPIHCSIGMGNQCKRLTAVYRIERDAHAGRKRYRMLPVSNEGTFEIRLS